MAEKVEVGNVLKNRNKSYGNSWLSITRAIDGFTEGDSSRLQKLMDTGHFANWVAIVGKLARAMESPNEPDHWIDIIGYATLSKALVEGDAEKFLPHGFNDAYYSHKGKNGEFHDGTDADCPICNS